MKLTILLLTTAFLTGCGSGGGGGSTQAGGEPVTTGGGGSSSVSSASSSSQSSASAPVITSTLFVNAQVGTNFNYLISALNNPTSFGATNLPNGLTITNGLISGNPTVAGSFKTTISVSNSVGTTTATLTIAVFPQPAPVITSPATSAIHMSKFFSYQITATNNPLSFGVSDVTLNGVSSTALSFDPTTGILSGTPTTSVVLTTVGTVTIQISATNDSGTRNGINPVQTTTIFLTLTVYPS